MCLNYISSHKTLYNTKTPAKRTPTPHFRTLMISFAINKRDCVFFNYFDYQDTHVSVVAMRESFRETVIEQLHDMPLRRTRRKTRH